MPKWGFKLKTDKILLYDVNKIKYIASRKFFGTEGILRFKLLTGFKTSRNARMIAYEIGMQTTSVS